MTRRDQLVERECRREEMRRLAEPPAGAKVPSAREGSQALAERIGTLQAEIESAYRHGWTPEHQLCELASIEECL